MSLFFVAVLGGGLYMWAKFEGPRGELYTWGYIWGVTIGEFTYTQCVIVVFFLTSKIKLNVLKI